MEYNSAKLQDLTGKLKLARDRFSDPSSHFRGEASCLGDWSVNVKVMESNKTLTPTVTIRLDTMYVLGEEAVQFDDLQFLSDLFETKNINVGEYNHDPGCDTCDYGSNSTVTIYVKDAKL